MRCCQTLHDAHGHICWAHRARLSCCADQRARLVVESLLHAALAPVRCCACFGSLFAWQATACWMVAWNLPASESACSQQARAPVLAMHVGTEARAAAEGARTLRRVRKCPRILVSSGGWRTCAWHAHAGVPSRPSRRRASCRSAPHREGQHAARQPSWSGLLFLRVMRRRSHQHACTPARWVDRGRGSHKQSPVAHLPHKHLLLGVGGAQAAHQERAAVRVQGLVASARARTTLSAQLGQWLHSTPLGARGSMCPGLSGPVHGHFAQHASSLWQPAWSAHQLPCKAWKHVCLCKGTSVTASKAPARRACTGGLCAGLQAAAGAQAAAWSEVPACFLTWFTTDRLKQAYSVLQQRGSSQQWPPPARPAPPCVCPCPAAAP